MTRQALQTEDGFTLVELLVAMTLTVIVLLATFQAFDVFGSGVAQQSRATAANERARQAVDRLSDDLRTAATVRVASPTDLVYSVIEVLPSTGPTGTTGTTQTRTERVCVTAANELYRSASVTSTTPGSACGTTGAGWTQSKLADLPTTSTTAFTYDGAATAAVPTKVRAVGVNLNLDASGPARRTASTTLKGGATVRRTAGALQVDTEDVKTSCNSSGALLSLDLASTTAKGLSGLTVSYATSAGLALGTGSATSSVQIAAGVTSVVATVTDAFGVSNTLQKVVECS